MNEIQILQLENGQFPFENWLLKQEPSVQKRVLSYTERLRLGFASKNVKPVGEGVFELKINYGPGFRVYFSRIGKVIILILLAGTKRTQSRDIEKAKKYWRKYHV